MINKANVRQQNLPLGRRLLLGVPVLLAGIAALTAPMLDSPTTAAVLGLLLAASGGVRIFSLITAPGGIPGIVMFVPPGASLAAGLLLLSAPDFTFSALAVLLGGAIMLDGGTEIVVGLRKRDGPWAILDGAFIVLVGGAVALQWPVSGSWSFGLAVGLRLLSTGWMLFLGEESKVVQPELAEAADHHPDPQLKLPPHPVFATMREALLAEEAPRRQTARYWRAVFVLTLFTIHASRMQVAGTVGGWWGPITATLGDVLLALLLAYLVVGPLLFLWHWATRPLERRFWQRYLRRLERGRAGKPPFGMGWARQRMRADLYGLHDRHSPTAAIGWGLAYGLPLTAVLAALTPLFGFDWFFNTESWTAVLNQYWATERTDPWRAQMVKAVRATFPEMSSDELFQVHPAGVDGESDFSFLVVGDPGEGDPSQYVLHDQILRIGAKPEVKFIVISSDVIYPSGEMHDYERKFYLPFKGFDKPIYAIPGNHDWFDGLEGFAANFFEPEAALTALRARRAADLNLTTLAEDPIQQVIRQARTLRQYYGLQVARQRAPFFELQTEDFALLAVDTGILRTVDPEQMAWLKEALSRSRGKFRMVILGHPLYATGRYRGDVNSVFAAIHRLLRQHQVKVVMAGDTHAFEYYRGKNGSGGDGDSTLYITNGGGGAYLSLETPLGWAAKPSFAEWAFYPRPDQITAKLDAQIPWWKQPLWLLVKYLDGWPLSITTLSSAFSYDQAPYFQSFMEVRVERSANRVLFRLYGAQGPLRWRDLQRSSVSFRRGRDQDDPVELALPLQVHRDGRKGEEERDDGSEQSKTIMKDGKIYKNTVK